MTRSEHSGAGGVLMKIGSLETPQTMSDGWPL